MATSGPNQSGTVAEFDDGWTAWSNVANAITFDQVYATIALTIDQYSNFLDHTSFGTFAGIGAGDSITAIEIEYAGKKAGSGSFVIVSVQLIVGGVVVGSSIPIGTGSWTGTESYSTTGVLMITSFDTTLVGSQLTSTFGVRVQFSNGGVSDTLSIDACRVTLTYTGGSSVSIGGIKSTNGIAGSGVF